MSLILDGFRNLVTKLGVRGKDRTTANSVAPARIVTDRELSSFYMGDGLGKRIVDMPADDATRSGWDFLGDPKQVLGREMQKLGVTRHYNEAIKWTRLYGGAITVLNWNDGRGLEQAFKQRTTNPYRIMSMRTYALTRLELVAADFETDPTAIRFEKPTFYTVKRQGGSNFRVHWTRVQEWFGVPVPDPNYEGLDIARRFFGMGVIQSVLSDVADLGLSWTAIAGLFQESVIGKYRLNNLEQLLAEGDEDAIVKRMENIQLSKSTINGVLLGAQEEYSRDSLPFSGVAEVLDRMMMRTSCVSGIPVSLLFGRGAAGMDATGEGDARMYYDGVSSVQIGTVEPRLVELKNLMVPYCVPETDAEMITPRFVPVWSPSQQNQVDMHLKQAQADQIYFAMQEVDGTRSLTLDEIRKNRFVGGYSFETSVETVKPVVTKAPEPVEPGVAPPAKDPNAP